MSRTKLGAVLITGLLTTSVLTLVAQSPPGTQLAGRGPAGSSELLIRRANEQFYAALNSMFKGDMEPMSEIWSHSEQATLMGPFGDRQVGWDQVRKQFETESKMNMAGRVTMRKPLVFAFEDWAYVIGVEEGENFTADGKPVRLGFRATNVFVREDGRWKMIHHHTDMGPALEEAAGHSGTRPHGH